MIRQKLGVCYYPEHWPVQRWAEDAARMKALGLSCVRIGEFAWSRLEPRPGVYDFDWLRQAIETLHAAALEIVLGAPTATPPKWLVDRMPDMLALDAEGRPRKFGSRRHYCFSHEGYARECDRIVTKLAEAFGAHPAIVAWQTDNEYGCHDTVESYSQAALLAFRGWCEKKYASIDALNAAWGNVFWSMELTGFDAIELPNLTVTEANPAHLLDFQRFSSDQVVAFNKRQVEIIRAHAPGRAILHNFMGAFTAFDHFALSQDLDAASWDSYPLGFLERSANDEAFKARYMRVGDPDFQAFHHDLYRGCGRGRWWVMEQQPGPVNWAPWNPAPAKGAVRMWTFEAFAAGAETVSYFRWRQAPFAQEQMHEALLLPNSEPNEAYRDVETVARELAALDARVETRRAEVALIFDYESAWAWRIEPQGQDFSYYELVLHFYRGLRRAGLSVDIGPPTPETVRDRKAVLAPGLFTASDDLVEALARSEARLLIGPRAGSKTADFQIPPDLPPGSLRKLIDLRVRRVESLRPGAAIATEAGHFERWREFLELGAGVENEIASVDDECALARQGEVFYLAGWPDDAMLDAVLALLLREAGVETLSLPRDVRIRDNGGVRYVFNYGPEEADISQIAANSRLILGEKRLLPCGVAAFARA
ncbi:beta-galactosidase [Methylocystis parvus]|uniref:Beta-galactosidase n=2 Tax=Methylocystis parvus TaxID=134 RepID=A0A6B8M6L4_9HYPH|nr:beta-galactosidase [Methylocystis parvus]QGM97339.1 beta-galactosidase [Methylocystis parvus]WBJ98750.1 beta-galactosidase [Methylocystis parvus OBBP]